MAATPALAWPTVWASGVSAGLFLRVTLAGISIFGAASLLAWAAETAEKDVSRSFAIAVLAVLAVAPEYAVDALYAWGAGIDPGTAASAEAADLAVANVTGANRILIGIGWSAIAIFTVYRAVRVGTPRFTIPTSSGPTASSPEPPSWSDVAATSRASSGSSASG